MDKIVINKLIDFLNLLIGWNEKYNLISINSIEELFISHVLDSFSLLECHTFNNLRICDIGTGAGFPGLILSILMPQNKYYFFEPQKKYYLFLKKTIAELKLDNISLINEKIENYQWPLKEIFDIILSRAVGKINHIIKICGKFFYNQNELLFLKGSQLFNELALLKRINGDIIFIKKVKILEMHNKNHYIIAIKS